MPVTDEKNVNEKYKEEMQEIMLELKIKTDKFLKKLKEDTKKSKIEM